MNLVHKIVSVIKDLRLAKHPDIKDCWGISVVFECQGCHSEYSITNYDKEENENFLQSLSNNTCTREDIWCNVCNEYASC